MVDYSLMNIDKIGNLTEQTNTVLNNTNTPLKKNLSSENLNKLENYYKRNNPGNIKYFSKEGIEGVDYYLGTAENESSNLIKYKKFNTKAEGLSAIANVIRNISENNNTNSLEKIMNIYAVTDGSGKRFDKYESRLKNTFNIKDTINLEDDKQVKNLIMGITDVENPTLNEPELNHNLYYFETDYDDAVNLFKDPVMAME